MQSRRRGLVPSTTGCVWDEDGNKCTPLSEQHHRWQWHFTKVLNMRSQFEVAEPGTTRQQPIRTQWGNWQLPSQRCWRLDASQKNSWLSYWNWCTWHGRNRECLETDQMQFLSPSQRKETYRFVTTGEQSSYWTWWEKWWLGSCRKGYSR